MRRLVCWLLFAGCGPARPVGHQREALINGTPDSGDSPVVGLLALDGQNVKLTFTGTVISPHVVLTCAHGVDPAYLGFSPTFYVVYANNPEVVIEPTDMAGSFGTLPNPLPSNVVPVHDYSYEPGFSATDGWVGHDIALLFTHDALTPTPVPLARFGLDSLSGNVRAVGYGRTVVDDSSSTNKSQFTVPVDSVLTNSLYVGDGTRVTCYGDSGSPLFYTPTGMPEVVVGVAHGFTGIGGAPCSGLGVYSRIDVSLSFIDQQVAANEPKPDLAMPPDLAQPVVDLANPDASVTDAGADPLSGSGCAFGGAAIDPSAVVLIVLLFIAARRRTTIYTAPKRSK